MNGNNNSKKLTIEVSTECLKVLKKLAIDKDTNASHIASDLLDKVISRKSTKPEDIN